MQFATRTILTRQHCSNSSNPKGICGARDTAMRRAKERARVAGREGYRREETTAASNNGKL